MSNFKRHDSPAGSPSRRRAATIDGFARRPNQVRPSLGFGDPAQKKLGGAGAADKGFGLSDGFHARSRTGTSMPDGTQVGRRPIKKSDLDISLKDGKPSAMKAKKHGRFRGGARRSFTGASLGILLLAGFLTGWAFLKANQVFQGGNSALALECSVDPQKLEKEGDGRVNVLLLGKGGAGHAGADLTDTLMVASIDSCQKEVGLLSLPRDLYVQMPDNGSMKINSIYATAKEQALYMGSSQEEAEKKALKSIQQVVAEVTGIPMHYYAMVDFEAFRKAIDTVGGIEVNAAEQLYDPTVAWENDWDPVIAEKGINSFNGEQALLYSRSRYGSERGDFDRAERQREVMLALQNKVFSLGTFSNPVKLSQLFGAFGDHAQTNLSIDDIMAIYDLMGEIEDHKVTSVSLADPPNEFVTIDNIGGLSVVIPKAGVYEYGDIHRFVRTTLRDGFLKKEDASILVLNGTNNPGAATEYADFLKGYGYKIAGTGDAPTKDFSQTVLISLRGNDKKYTKRYLEQRLKTSSTSRLPDGINAEMADFVIIVGQDEASL